MKRGTLVSEIYDRNVFVWGKKKRSPETGLLYKFAGSLRAVTERQALPPSRWPGCTGWFSTWIAADGDRTADDAGNAAGHRDADLTGHAF